MLKELKIDQQSCVGCKKCLDVCHSDVIYWDVEANLPYAKYPLDCQVCCICEAACPKKALTVVPDWSRKYYPRYISREGEQKNV